MHELVEDAPGRWAVAIIKHANASGAALGSSLADAFTKALAADPALYNQTHLLSISFDPAYDTPKVLRSYGNLYTGEHGEQAFSHWDFVVPPAPELDTVDAFFDVGVSSGSDHTLTHSLSTAVIAPDGKIFRWYPNNDWAPSTVIDDVKQAIVRASGSR